MSPCSSVTRYVVALGSNRRSPAGSPADALRAALAMLEALPNITLLATARIRPTPALGPGGRRFANGGALIETALTPPALLALLKRIERAAGRRGGRRWGARTIDLDILLWSAGRWPRHGRDVRLTVPHRALAGRRFALEPAAELAGDWRLEGARVRHALARLTRARRSA